jgi:hypothetical protein
VFIPEQKRFWSRDHRSLDALDSAAANTEFGCNFQDALIAERQRLPNRGLLLAVELWPTERLSGFSSFFASPPNTDSHALLNHMPFELSERSSNLK